MPRSSDELKRMGTPHPDLLAALETEPFPDLTNGDPMASIFDVRQNRAEHLAKLRHLYPIPGPIPDSVREIEHQVPVHDGSSVRVRIYVPTKTSERDAPLILMMHEGGWTMGDLTDEDQNCRMFARDLGAVCVNIEYRLGPEHPFPTGVNDCWDVVQWCAKTASPSSDILPASPRSGFIVGGASAGGNLAAVMCQLSRDEGLTPPLTGQYLCVPALLWWDVVPEKWAAEYESRTEAKFDPVLKLSNDKNSVIDALKADTTSPLFSPLLHSNLKGLAPAYFQLAGLDPLRDEGLLYEKVLREEYAVPTRLEVYDGFGHMFWTNWPTLVRSQEFVRDTLEGVRWLLSQRV
ncbi:hypothetical protein LTR56_019514 [Elasticomyces elasticus]|nr:hypothetical protein LTR56_019514 [Elasticomyces elasticus]KAK3653724.1 hypothetical protein LTR22_011102 [Elasticomyces elasticus]KAK4924167.1 hypothetical protein LTR49_008687 [Elasticomyces elasticus]KAK5758515.1 hypothetical protein LTS12_011378 [Elasticomyces elasticus]